ncbi:Secreted RxLR effector protein 3 [Phytophthora ramorum]|uniref:Secreted RxLR effector protein 3 n=1 Tax=Phytophthora ramorum TaxID=164328 RepID=UPI0030B7E507|nr:Secreted RxLR effector protein 3 [Phytophthora ramorum]
MRRSCVLLVAVVTLITTEVGAEKHFLRTHKTLNFDDSQEEERGLNWMDELKLPQMFKRLKSERSYQDSIFASWKYGMRSVDEAVAFMKRESLNEKAIAHFKKLYTDYLILMRLKVNAHRG